ncbi:MAG TPA: DivIVA domain-containing protein [Coriobacteriia bacterium]
MKLTPLDIHHKEFRVALRGYNQEEVDAFLDEVADEFERLFKENIDLSEKLDAANEKVRTYAEMERTLHNTMLAAQQSAEEIGAKAVKESELLMRDAEIKAKELVQDALAQKQRTQSEFMRIKQVEDEFRIAFRTVLEDHMRKLHAIPVAEDVAAMVGISQESAAADIQAASVPAAADAAEPSAVEPVAPPQVEEVAADPAGEPSYAEALASGPGDVLDASARPRAQARRTPDPIAAAPAQEPPVSGFVQSITLGEVAGPDLGVEVPVFEEPTDFRPGRFGAVGEREDDLDIEEID